MAWRSKAGASAVLLEKHRICPPTNASDLTKLAYIPYLAKA